MSQKQTEEHLLYIATMRYEIAKLVTTQRELQSQAELLDLKEDIELYNEVGDILYTAHIALTMMFKNYKSLIS